MMFEILLAFVVFLLVYKILDKNYSFWKNRGVPYEKPWPIVGNMGQFLFRQLSVPELTNSLYKTQKTRYIGFYQMLKPTLMIRDIELIKQIAVKEFDHFMNHRTLISEESDPLMGKNLFSLKDKKWKNMRSTLSPAFTSSKMKAMFSLISETAEQFTTYFTKTGNNTSETISIEMKDCITRYANDVIATIAFGIKCDSLKERENEFYVMGKDSTNFTGIRNLILCGYVVIPSVMKFFAVKLFSLNVSNFFRKLVKETMMIREREGIIRPDMIHLLMEARKGQLKHNSTKEDDDAGFATVKESDIGKENLKHNQEELTDDDLTAQALLFFIAGFDTVSTNMCFMAHELAINPVIQERLQEEIDQMMNEHNEKPTYEAVTKMKYLDMVVSETLRKWPSAAVTDRVCSKPFTIHPEYSYEKPVHLSRNDVVWIPIYAIHRDPQYYPDPDKFDPERFSDENKTHIKPFSYLPFGIGPRNCIGSRFALLEMKILFCYLLHKFNIVVTNKTQIPIKFSAKQFTVNSERGFWLGLSKRNQKQN